MKKNEKGSSLIFAVVVIMILSVVIAAALAISYTYYNRSIANNNKRQAYLTAKSVVTNIVDNINTTDYKGLIPDGVTESKKTFNVDEGFPSEMGMIEKDKSFVSIKQETMTEDSGNEYVQETITISVTATYAGKTAILNADLARVKDSKSDWNFLRYYEGEPGSSENKNNLGGNKLYEYANGIITLYQEDKVGWKDKLQYDDKVNKVYSELYKNVEKMQPGLFSKIYFNDSKLRELVFYGYYLGQFDEFDNSLVNADISEKAKKFLETNKDIFICVKYPYSSGSPCIIFAYTANEANITNWNFTSHVIYYPLEQAWYYVYDGVKIQSFDDNNKTETAKQLWIKFVDETLHNTNKAEKIT